MGGDRQTWYIILFCIGTTGINISIQVLSFVYKNEMESHIIAVEPNEPKVTTELLFPGMPKWWKHYFNWFNFSDCLVFNKPLEVRIKISCNGDVISEKTGKIDFSVTNSQLRILDFEEKPIKRKQSYHGKIIFFAYQTIQKQMIPGYAVWKIEYFRCQNWIKMK